MKPGRRENVIPERDSGVRWQTRALDWNRHVIIKRCIGKITRIAGGNSAPSANGRAVSDATGEELIKSAIRGHLSFDLPPGKWDI